MHLTTWHKYVVKSFCLTVLILSLTSCTTSPTGRSQLLLFSNQQLDQMGEQAFTAMKSDLKVSRKKIENRYVKCVTDAILPHVPQNAYKGAWEAVVFDDPQINAFALPGGKIGVYTGILNVAKTQDQLAAIIGHEIGHVIAQHSNERMSQSQLINMGSQAINVVLAENEVANNQSIMAAIGLGVQVGFQLPYSRAHESEADLIGLVLMAKAGFDPRESISLWQNMAAAAGSRQPELLSTHPSPASRIEALRKNMAGALADYQSTTVRPDCG